MITWIQIGFPVFLNGRLMHHYLYTGFNEVFHLDITMMLSLPTSDQMVEYTAVIM